MKNKIYKIIIYTLLFCTLIGAIVCGAQATTEQKTMVISDKQNRLHEMAEQARSWGIAEDDILIKRLQELWWEEYYILEKQSQTQEEITTETIEKNIINPEELEMLACVIYQEAGGNSCTDYCRYCVGDVVLNRIADSRFPNTMYEVLTQKGQYGRYYWTGIVWPSRASNPNEAKAVQRAYDTAQDLLEGNHSELYGAGYVWQASFKQGKDNIYICGMYFGR